MTESFLLLDSLGIHFFFSAQSWTILLKSQSRGERVLDKASISYQGEAEESGCNGYPFRVSASLILEVLGYKMDVIIGASW